MGVPQGWRLRKQRFSLIGESCLNCGHKLFPPRDVCPECGASAKAKSSNEVLSYVLFYRVSAPASLTR